MTSGLRLLPMMKVAHKCLCISIEPWYRTFEHLNRREFMKKIIYILIILLVLAFTLSFFIKDRKGRPLISFDPIEVPEISMPDFNKLIEKVTQPFEKNDDDESDDKVIYRWKNSEGVWCYSNQPNPDGDSEIMKANREINVVKMVQEQPKEDPEKVKREGQQKPSAHDIKDKPSPETPISSLPILQAPELLEKAQELKKNMDKRTQDMEKFVDEEM